MVPIGKTAQIDRAEFLLTDSKIDTISGHRDTAYLRKAVTLTMEEHHNLLIGVIDYDFWTGYMRFEALTGDYTALFAQLLIGHHGLIERQNRVSKQVH